MRHARYVLVAIVVTSVILAGVLTNPQLFHGSGATPSTSQFLSVPFASSFTANNSTYAAGYQVDSLNDTIYSISGSWIVPTISTCSVSDNSTWGETLDMVGTEAQVIYSEAAIGSELTCLKGNATYSVFYDTPGYPLRGIQTDLPIHVHPGDAINASLQIAHGSMWENLTDGQQVLHSKTPYQYSPPRVRYPVKGADLALCVVDTVVLVTSSEEEIYNDPKFTKTSFGQDSTNLTGTCNVTEENPTSNAFISGPIGSFGNASWAKNYTSLYQLRLGTNATGTFVVDALPSALSADGSSFSVTWKGYVKGLA
jgi:Peptidase A4 family